MVELNGFSKLCVFLLSVLGLWPYGNKKLRLFKNIFFSVSVWLCVLVQVQALITMEMTLHRMIRNLTCMTVSIGSLVKYHAIWYEFNTVKGAIDLIKLNWQTNNDVILQILKKHNYSGKQLSTLFTVFVYLSSGITMLWDLTPIILDQIAPLNESRPIMYSVDVELVTYRESHPIAVTIIYYFWLGMLASIYAGTESLTIMFCLHITSLFEVTSYYFQTSVSIEVTEACIPRKHTNNNSMSNLIEGVFMHTKTIQFFNNYSDHALLTYIPIVILGVTSLSINLFFLSQSILYSANIGENMFYLLLVIAVIQYMFLINLAIQYVMDGAANISTAIYNTSWYETSVATQKLLQMVILRSNKGSVFTMYNMYDASLRGFSVLLQMSLSYFTVLISL